MIDICIQSIKKILPPPKYKAGTKLTWCAGGAVVALRSCIQTRVIRVLNTITKQGLARSWTLKGAAGRSCKVWLLRQQLLLLHDANGLSQRLVPSPAGGHKPSSWQSRS